MVVSVSNPRTLYDKIWDDHVVSIQETGDALIYIDRHLVHEVTSPQAFEGLRFAKRPVRRTDCTLATVDHNLPTRSRKNFSTVQKYIQEADSLAQCVALEENVKAFGLTYFGVTDRRQGIVHIIGPEQGFTLPGITCVCGDSHTSTHGAFGSIAFGIGTSEVEHVLATQTLLQRKSKNMRITVDGTLSEGVGSKDVILYIIGKIGTAGGTGCVIEYAGSVFRGFSMEARMSVCNMSIEAGARAGMVAPDEVTFEYLKNRPLVPKGAEWDKAVEYWKTLKSDDDAVFDIEINIRAEDIIPTVTWGTSPQDVVPITGFVPDPAATGDKTKQASGERSLTYMGLKAGTPMEEIVIQKAFIGSCTNGRIEDLRSAARVVLAAGSNGHVAEGVYAMIVPGSGLVKEQAEKEGLDVIFKRAGFDWREPGCSMCLGMNDDQLSSGERCASTSNRNFEGRQGAGGRTHLMSPAMATAAALVGKLADVRKVMGVKLSSEEDDVILVKATDSKSYLTDPVLPSPAPGNEITPGAEAVTVPHPDPKEAVSSEITSTIDKFTVLTGIAAPLDMENVDTDMIIPKQFLKTLKRTGLGTALFHTLRKDPNTGADTDFVLNRKPYDQAKVLVVTGRNFGCGSSREHAPWSLNDFGIRAIIAPSFAEIFRSNALLNGMLPIALPVETCKELAVDAHAGKQLTVDLEKLEIRRPDSAGSKAVPFEIDSFRRYRLLNGLDDVALTMQNSSEAIDTFEARRSAVWPWLDGFGYKPKQAQKGNVIPATEAVKPSKKLSDW